MSRFWLRESRRGTGILPVPNALGCEQSHNLKFERRTHGLEARATSEPSSHPRLAILRPHELIGLRIARHELLGVPLDVAPDAQGHHPGQADFGQVAAEVEVGPDGSLAVAGLDPFFHV